MIEATAAIAGTAATIVTTGVGTSEAKIVFRAKSVGMSRASVTLSATNLLTIWREQLSDFGVRHTDAEVRNISDPSVAYFQEGWPQTRRFLVTLRMTR